MSKVSRREFLKKGKGGAAVAGVALGVGALGGSRQAEASSTNATLDYPEAAIARANELKPGDSVGFNYPDQRSPCLLIKMDGPVIGGVGPGKDIVAYSTLCTHMGCPVLYDSKSRNFKCPCHYSVFDSEKEGQMVTGQATENLPRITLSHNTSDDRIVATGVDGLIYGRQANTLK